MSGFISSVRSCKRHWTMVGMSLNVIPSSSPLFSSLKLKQPMGSMAQNGQANARVMRKSKKTMTVAKNPHTVKHIVLGGIHTHKVNYLSQTSEGRRHDKKIV